MGRVFFEFPLTRDQCQYYLSTSQGQSSTRLIFKAIETSADEVLGHGTVDRAPVYPREVIKRALELSSTAIILAHNHPSGDPTPSHSDIEMTNNIIAAAKPLGVAVHDHLIIGRDSTVSFKTLGLM